KRCTNRACSAPSGRFSPSHRRHPTLRPVLRKKNQRHRGDASRRRAQSPKSRQVTTSFDVGQLTTKDVLHRNPNALLLRKRLGLVIPSVHVPDHTHPGIGGQHPLNALPHHFRSVGHQHLACV